MGLILKILGVVFMVVGLIMTLTIIGAPVGIGVVINGIVLVAIGGIYSDLDHVIKLIKKEA